MVMLTIGEWRPDASDLQGNWTQFLSNLVPRSDGYGPFHDATVFTQALPATCRGYHVAYAEDGTVRIFAGTATRLYLLSNTTLEWEDVSKDGLAYSSLNDNANWVFAQFNNIVVATQRNDEMQAFDIQLDTEFDELGTDPNRPAAGWVRRVGPFLMAGDLADDPFRVQWSGLNEIDNWTSTTNSSDYQDFPDGGRPLMGQEVEGGVAIVLQQDGARRMVFSSGSEAIFDIDRLQNVPGILGPYSAVVSSGGVYYLSTRGYVVVGADGSVTPIGEERINRTFLGQLTSSAPEELTALAYDETAPQLVIGVADPRQSLLLWGYKSSASADAAIDRGLLYHTVLKRWSPVSFAAQYLAPVSRPGLTLEGLDAIAPGAQDISGCADNGSGLIRVTVGSTSGWATGNSKTISGVNGTTEANGTWIITVVNGTTIDLQGSTFANAYVDGGIVGGSLDDLPFSLDSVSTASLPNVSLIDASGRLGFFDGDTLEASALTAEQSLSSRRMNINGIRPTTDAPSLFGSVWTRGNLHEVPTHGTEAEMDEDGYCPLLDEGRYARAKLRIPSGVEWSFVAGAEPDASPAGGF
jgi:hypothetical protein